VLITPWFSKNTIKKYSIVASVILFFTFLIIFFSNFYFATNLGPIASYSSGIYSEPFEVIISNPIPHSEIRFTIDKLKPTSESLAFVEPLKVNDSLIIRAQSFRNGEPIGLEKIYSYIFMNRDTNLPVVNLILDHNDLYDPKIGIYRNFNKDWHRPAQFTFYPKGSLNPEFTLNATARIYGGKSRTFPRKSFFVCFDKGSLNYKIFEKSDIEDYNCLTIRNSGNDFNHTFIRDSLIHNFASENTSIYFQDSTHIILYLNDRYFGIYDIRETKNANTLGLKYGAAKDDFAILYHQRTDGKLLKNSGTKNDIEKFKDFQKLLSLDTDNSQIISQIEEIVDIDNYFEYQIIQTYFSNFDYIYHNYKMFRYNGFIPEKDTFKDGRFRWLLYDTDVGLGFTTRDFDIFYIILGKANRNPANNWQFETFKGLMKGYYYKEKFANMYADYLNSKLLPENVISYINKYATLIEPEVPYHIERWKGFRYGYGDKDEYEVPLKSKEEWDYNVQEMRDFVLNRREEVFRDLDSNFSLGGSYTLTIKNKSPDMGYVKVNSLEIKSESWEGIYFSDVAISYEPIPYEGFEFVGWQEDTKELKIPNFRKL